MAKIKVRNKKGRISGKIGNISFSGPEFDGYDITDNSKMTAKQQYKIAKAPYKAQKQRQRQKTFRASSYSGAISNAVKEDTRQYQALNGLINPEVNDVSGNNGSNSVDSENTLTNEGAIGSQLWK